MADGVANKRSRSPRNMFAKGFDERHDLEQYFWTDDTVERLMNAIEHFAPSEGSVCCLATPTLASGWQTVKGRTEPLLDIDRRFDVLPGFRHFDITAQNEEDPLTSTERAKMRIVVFDPPFFYIPMETMFRAVCHVVKNDFSMRILMGFLLREETEMMRYFHVFGLRPTSFPLEYAAVKSNKWRNYVLYSNVDLPGIKRLPR